MQLIRALKRADTQKGLHLSYLHRLVDLYQHPLAAREDFDRLPVADLVQASPKLQGVLDCLRSIQAQQEKVLIFARHHRIQRMLARVIGATFGLDVSIINGETGHQGLPATQGRQQRAIILQRFKAQPGFHALVLSPFVAGVGLTITEANHVIHYGRWWNPAVEAQATDRVYRIGQDREVRVHLPVLQDPQGRLGQSFDQRLHALLERKQALAQDFLAPRDDEKSLAAELCQGLAEDLTETTILAAEHLDRDSLGRVPRELFEAYAALVQEQEGWSVQLADPRHSAGLSLVAEHAGKVRLVKVTDRSRDEDLQEDYALLKALSLGPGKMERVLIARRASQAWLDLPRSDSGPMVWDLPSLVSRQRQPLEETDLLVRNEARSPISMAQ